jgi:hypothetical protein
MLTEIDPWTFRLFSLFAKSLRNRRLLTFLPLFVWPG